MSFELAFKASALKEWKKLGHTVREQFKKKLAERLESPHVPSTALSGAANLYKIKLRQAGYRLVYEVEDRIVTVTVVAVGKRGRNEIYDVAMSRLKE
jgi:mRNA interferase RelE/StbE